MPHLKPVGHQSTNWMVRLVLMVATAAFTSFGTTSPEMKLEVYVNMAILRVCDLFGMLSLPDPFKGEATSNNQGSSWVAT